MNWLKYKKYYLLFSSILIMVSAYGLVVWGLKLGVDFKGGAVIEYKFNREISSEDLTKKLEAGGFEITAVQLTSDNTYIIKMPSVDETAKVKIASLAGELLSENTDTMLGVEELRFENVGPSIGSELVRKTFYAVILAAIGILFWVAYQFKSIKYGISAILAMFHDSFILVGAFSVLGHFLRSEVDFLFVTALLTTLSFSVHDTIVVFDRIRELKKKEGGTIEEISNRALTETMVRSLNNSFTIIFMLISLILLGGTTVKWFAVALLIGTMLGTYSSPFVAVPLLISWDNVMSYFKGKVVSYRQK